MPLFAAFGTVATGTQLNVTAETTRETPPAPGERTPAVSQEGACPGAGFSLRQE